MNMEYMGGWKRHKFEYVAGAGVRDLHHSAERRRRADELADSLTGTEQAVALYTTEGSVADGSMWLMKPTNKPWKVSKMRSIQCHDHVLFQEKYLVLVIVYWKVGTMRECLALTPCMSTGPALEFLVCLPEC